MMWRTTVLLLVMIWNATAAMGSEYQRCEDLDLTSLMLLPVSANCSLTVAASSSVTCLVSNSTYGQIMLSVAGSARSDNAVTNITLRGCRPATPWSLELGSFLGSARLDVVNSSISSVLIGVAGKVMDFVSVDVNVRDVEVAGGVILMDFVGSVGRLSILMDHVVYSPATTSSLFYSGKMVAVFLRGLPTLGSVDVTVQHAQIIASSAVTVPSFALLSSIETSVILCNVTSSGLVSLRTHNISVVFDVALSRYTPQLLQNGVITDMMIIRVKKGTSAPSLRIIATNITFAMCVASSYLQVVLVEQTASGLLNVMVRIENVTVANASWWVMPAANASSYRFGFIAFSMIGAERGDIRVSRVHVGSPDVPARTLPTRPADAEASSSSAYGFSSNSGCYFTIVDLTEAKHTTVDVSSVKVYVEIEAELLTRIGTTQLIRSMLLYVSSAVNVTATASDVTISVDHVGPLCASASRLATDSMVETQATIIAVIVSLVTLLGKVHNTTVLVKGAMMSSSIGSLECMRTPQPAWFWYSGVKVPLPNIQPQAFLSYTAFTSGQPPHTNLKDLFVSAPDSTIQRVLEGYADPVDDASTLNNISLQLTGVVLGKRFENALLADSLNVTKATPTISGGSGSAYVANRLLRALLGHVFLMNTVTTGHCIVVIVSPQWQSGIAASAFAIPIPPLLSAVNVSLSQGAVVRLTADGADGVYSDATGSATIDTALQYAVVLQNVSGPGAVRGKSAASLIVTLRRWRRFPALSQSFVAVDGFLFSPTAVQIAFDNLHFLTAPRHGPSLGFRTGNALTEMPPHAVEDLRSQLGVTLRCVTRDGVPPPLRRVVYPPTSALVRHAITYEDVAGGGASCAVPLPLWTETVVPVLPRGPAKTPIPNGVEIGVVGGFLTVPTPSAITIGLLQQNIRLLQQAARCASPEGDESPEESDFMQGPLDNPFGWSIHNDAGDAMGYAAGAVAGNVMLVAAGGMLLYICQVTVLVYQRTFTGRSWRWVLREGSLRTGGLVTSYMIGYMTLLQPVVAASVALLIRGSESTQADAPAVRERWVAIGACGVVLAAVPFLAWTVRIIGTWRGGTSMPLRLKRSDGDPNGAEADGVACLNRVWRAVVCVLDVAEGRRSVNGGGLRRHVAQEWSFVPRREVTGFWTSGLLRAAVHHPRLYVPVIEPYVAVRVWYFVIDFGLNACAAGVIAGAAEGQRDCGWTLWAALMVCCGTAATVVLLRPHRSRVDWLLTVAGALCATGSAIASVSAPGSAVANDLLLVQASLSFLPVVVGVLRVTARVVSLLLKSISIAKLPPQCMPAKVLSTADSTRKRVLPSKYLLRPLPTFDESGPCSVHAAATVVIHRSETGRSNRLGSESMKPPSRQLLSGSRSNTDPVLLLRSQAMLNKLITAICQQCNP